MSVSISHDPSDPLPSILEKQANNPLVRNKIIAVYPRSQSASNTVSYAEVSYVGFARLVEAEAWRWFSRLLPLLSAQKDEEAPVIALLADSGFQFSITLVALLKLNVTVFLLAPSVGLNSCNGPPIATDF